MASPLLRGMFSYGTIWPTCSVVQEYLEHGTSPADADWARAARFGLYGSFLMAPLWHGWMKYSNRFFTKKDILTSMKRAVIEQVTFSPVTLAFFFFGMSVLERKPLESCVGEVREKFWPTYKANALFWPTAQTLNFYLVPERHRMVFISASSFVWTVFMAHMKAKRLTEDVNKESNESTDKL